MNMSITSSTDENDTRTKRAIKVVTRKEPTQLDFQTFFHLVDNMTREDMLKYRPYITSTVHLYRSDIQTTNTFSLFSDPAVAKGNSDMMFDIINQHTYDYYCIVTEGWKAANASVGEAGYKHGDIARLPTHKKQEVLIIDGKTKDRKESLFVVYNIIRERPEDDTSRVLRFEKWRDSSEGSPLEWGPEARKKWQQEHYVSKEFDEYFDEHFSRLLVNKSEPLCIEPGLTVNNDNTEQIRYKVHESKHKEPTSLDFYTFLHLIDKTARNNMSKHEAGTSTSVHLYSKDTQTTTSFLISVSNNHDEVLLQLSNRYKNWHYYAIVVTAEYESIEMEPKTRTEGYKKGDTTELTIEKKQETLTIEGKSKDGRRSSFVIYDIIRDDSSRILRFEEWVDSSIFWGAESTIKRKWYPSVGEMMDALHADQATAVPSRTDGLHHEIYCSRVRPSTINEDESIGEHICAVHYDAEILHDAMKSLIDEEVAAVNVKKKASYTLKTVQMKMGTGTLKSNGRRFHLVTLTIFVTKNNDGRFMYVVNDTMSFYSRRPDDDYSKGPMQCECRISPQGYRFIPHIDENKTSARKKLEEYRQLLLSRQLQSQNLV